MRGRGRRLGPSIHNSGDGDNPGRQEQPPASAQTDPAETSTTVSNPTLPGTSTSNSSVPCPNSTVNSPPVSPRQRSNHVRAQSPSQSMAPTWSAPIEPFCSETMKWSVYKVRVDQYFIAQDITTDDKKRAQFLTLAGMEICELLYILYSPVDPISKKYEDYCTTLSNHFDKKKLEVAERFNFYQRKQGPTESIKEYSAELRDFARHCNFGTFLDSALRDAFVMGIKDERVQRKLLTTDALTFTDAIKTAEASESLENQSQALRPNREDLGLNINVAQETRGGTGRCHRCLGWNHAPQYCPYLRETETCYKCQQVGHTSAACHTQSTRQNQANARGGCPGLHRPADGRQSSGRFSRADQSNRYRDQEPRRSTNSGGGPTRRVYYAEQEGTRMEESEQRPAEEPRYRNERSRQEEEMEEYGYEYEEEYTVKSFYEEIHHIKMKAPAKPFLIPVKLDGQFLQMELDTGAARSLISEETWKK